MLIKDMLIKQKTCIPPDATITNDTIYNLIIAPSQSHIEFQKLVYCHVLLFLFIYAYETPTITLGTMPDFWLNYKIYKKNKISG